MKKIIPALLIVDGFVAGVPQIWRICARQSSNDISLTTWGWMFLMACLWAIQAHRDKSRVVFLGSIVWALNNAAVLFFAVIFR